MENIINIAIEGGYKKYHIWGYEESLENKFIIVHGDNGERVETIPIKYVVLDHFFWQSLGRACGWDNGVSEEEWKEGKGRDDWKDIALRFYEENLMNGWDSAIKYLEDLLTQKP